MSTLSAKPSPELAGYDGAVPLSDAEFAWIRDLIYTVAGISLAPGKKELVHSRLARRLRARRVGSFSEYLRLLQKDTGQEREAFINSLTTNTTSFFREPHHFEMLANHCAALPKNKSLSIWSCAASTGEEPYSIAMTLADLFPGRIRIFASDIDTDVLDRARLGVYAMEQVEKLPPAQVKRFFLRGSGDYAGFVKIRPEIAAMVSFHHLNLLGSTWPVEETFDAIFCRNVMIYFDKKTQYRVLQKLRPHLKKDGLLFVGHSESLYHATDLFRLYGKTTYVPQDRGNA